MIWQNWGRTVACRPVEVATASDTTDVQRIVQDAAGRGLTVKAVGAGHSFSPIAEASGIQLSLDPCTGIVAVDTATKRVTVRAGTRLHQLGPLLAAHGLAMENLGDIDRQSVAGAIATGTHGTGLGFGGIATQVVGLTLVDGRGGVHRVEGPDLAAHVVGLGALGIVTEVALQCVDAFVLDAVERPLPLGEVLGSFSDLVHEHDHFEFYWFPHTTTALTKGQRRLPGDSERHPLSRARRWLDDDLVANRLYGLTCRLSAAAPALTPTINRLADKLTGDRAFSDWSTSVYTTRRDVRFREMEYALPLDELPDAVRELDALIRRRRWRISFPLECRAVAADDLWLSTATGRDTGYVAVHRYVRDDHREYFAAAEDVFVAAGGRPHWGKMHTRTRADLDAVYPRLADFTDLRDRRDPDRVFTNPYLDRVLGR